MKTKKFLALILAMILALSVLTCAVADNSEPLEFVKLKAIAVGDKEDTSDRYLELLNEKLLRDLNCELEIEYISWSDVATKYPLCFASGEDFDFIYTADWNYYGDQAVKGGFYALSEDDLKTYMPKTYEAVGKDGWNMTKVNGNIYMIPASIRTTTCDKTCFIVRGDLMAEAGLEEITSAKDFETYLDYVVANHPELIPLNITGIANAEWAMMIAANLVSDTYEVTNMDYSIGLGSALASLATIPTIIDYSDPANLKYFSEEEVDAYYLKIFHKTKEMFEKGYWASDCLSSTTDIADYYLNGQGAAAVRQLIKATEWANTLYNTNPEMDPHIVRFADFMPYIVQCTTNGIGIHATTKNLERTMMVLEKIGYDQEYYDLTCFGVEGEHYTLDDNGNVIQNPEKPWYEPNQMGFETNIKRQLAVAENAAAKESAALMEYCVENGHTPALGGFNFNNEPVATEYASIVALNSRKRKTRGRITQR